ncbi:Bifunctional transcriptional activator/DNA repair enzyme Ada [Zhongshania aliphaticivorans]|uniref:methylated-DNA--[protein]-cysteine S-methyltransferase n=1 Tax=Zhongshania aliphaticivorans TaxID=1470434 RepID=A0A5S9N1I2_9GAMM|nr:methylated-DNA--[protein]-cysteine S-methyltransferase [Zhongshania aliphaticivorans]CAA0082647.1 Bifunctional transcriptional activator/DNA repair enzyme Ada [Zhongshania aliphaticivorans]CAA0084066.1 Bifunctional transcriptional activator/DNA repair enzyme Ada [Zhongshania aliphaticivorans]
MNSTIEQQHNYQRVASAIAFLSEHQQAQPSLSALAAHVGVSESHLQRIFTEWAGVSPKQFLQFLTKQSAKRLLRTSTVMDSALACGLSGSGRLHDLMIKTERVTPGEYRNRGEGLQIYYGCCPSAFGGCFIAVNKRGVCKLAFFDTAEDEAGLLTELASEWSAAELVRDNEKAAQWYQAMFAPKPDKERQEITVLLKGSEFQMKVWEALLAIPVGEVCSYQQLAGAMGSPSSTRAVASAIARNNIAYLIPCHRVIRGTGEFSQYRWGARRKQAMLLWESGDGYRT